MGIYQPLPLCDENHQPIGLWHYTYTDHGGTRAVGHCSEIETCPNCKGRSGLLRHPDQPPCERCQDKGILRRANPCPGHATPAEATAHYREYLLDNARYGGCMAENEQRKCAVCGDWTQGVAIVGDYHHDLCDSHRNREGLERVAGKHGEPIKCTSR